MARLYFPWAVAGSERLAVVLFDYERRLALSDVQEEEQM